MYNPYSPDLVRTRQQEIIAEGDLGRASKAARRAHRERRERRRALRDRSAGIDPS